VSDAEAELPAPFAEALAYVHSHRDGEVRIDAVKDNFAYLWIGSIAKNQSSETPGGWIRLPLAFPYANPHGLVTREALRSSGERLVSDGHNPNHDMCAPVRGVGGAHYYSWTWENAPQLRSPQDIVGVVQWYERRIRLG
jgi:hypothetical protein